MFCSKCGKEINMNDRFCSSCGAPVAREENSFNPPFKIEAEKRTEAILNGIDNGGSSLKHIDIPWDLGGMPTGEAKKTKDIDFNWESVLERKKEERAGIERPLGFKEKDDEGQLFTNKETVSRATREIEIEEIRRARMNEHEEFVNSNADIKEAPNFDEILEVVKKMEDEPTLSTEELESEIFRDMGKLPERRTEEQSEIDNEEIDRLFVESEPQKEDVIYEEENMVWQPIGVLEEQEEDEPVDGESAKGEEEPEESEESEDSEAPKETETPEESETPETPEESETPETLEESGAPEETAGEEAPMSEEEQMDQKLKEELKKATILKPEEKEAVTKKEKQDREKFYTYHSKIDEFEALMNSIKPENVTDDILNAKGEKAEEPKQETKAEAKPNKEKLRYSDVFPRTTVELSEGQDLAKSSKKNMASNEMDLYQTKPKKKHVLLKIIIILLVLLLVLEAALVIVRTFAPESQIAINFGQIIAKISEFLAGLGK